MRAVTAHRLAMMVALVCVLAVAGCGKKQDVSKGEDTPKQAPSDSKQPPKTETDAPTPSKPPANLADAKPDLKFTTKEYEAESKKEFFFLTAKHPGKVVEVTGVVKSFGSNGNDLIVFLESDALIGPALKLGDNKAWLKALPRQTVTLRAAVPTERNVLKVDWQVITVTGSPPPTLTAEEFLKESKVGLTAIAEKYGKGLVIVSGTIAEVKVDMNGTTVELAGEKDEKLTCFFSAVLPPIPMTEQQRKALKPGLKVKILGEPSVSQLISCVLLEPAP